MLTPSNQPDRRKCPTLWADWLANRVLREVKGAVNKELMEGGRKWRIRFTEGDYVDIHRYEEPDKYAIHYRHPSGRFIRWNNALDRIFPRKPHIHAGIEGVEEHKSEDLSEGDPNLIIERLRGVRGSRVKKRGDR